MTAPGSEDHDGFRPGRLRSLWDMLNHDAARFYFSSAALAMSRTGLVHNHQETQRIDPGGLGRFQNDLESVKATLPPGCELAGISIDELLEIFAARTVLTVGDLNLRLMIIEGRIVDGLKQAFLLSLSPAEAALYEPKTSLFGDKFGQQFSSAVYEIDEAAKCLALARSTASAFHSIRCLEAGIAALSRCLSIPDPTKAHERNWGKILKAVKDAMDARWPTSSDRMRGDGQFFDEAYAALAAMQNPWRNATMHLDQKYTPDEARHIFDVVKGFMVRVANRMDENGDPKA